MNAAPSAMPCTGSDSEVLPTIIVVEDEVLLRLWISDELRDSGFTVLEAANAAEALQILNSSVTVHVVLTDVRMPGRMDGVALAEWLRRERPEVKVIIASSLLGYSAAHVSITKPYSADQVINIIAELSGLRGTQGSPAG
jgi:CheY-like chemotaxis protein